MRAHYRAPIQDNAGNLLPGSVITLYQNGTTTLLAVPVWADGSSSTALGNPYTSPDGYANFYLDASQRIDMQIAAPGQPPKTFSDVDVEEAGVTSQALTFPGTAANSTALGSNATATAVQAVALGDSAMASGSPSLAVGQGATVGGAASVAAGPAAVANPAQSTAIGASATAGTAGLAAGYKASSAAATTGGIAVGANASATAPNSMALGSNASAAGTHSTAIGAGAAVSASNQVMLGTSADTVVIPGGSPAANKVLSSLDALGTSAWVTAGATPVIASMPAPSGDTTGVTDTAAYTTAVTPLITTGGILQFQAGRYYISQMLLYSSVEYWGDVTSILTGPPGTIITAPSGSSQDMVVPSGTPVSCGMRYLALDGGNGNNSAVLVQAHQFNGINLTAKVSRGVFSHINVLNIPGTGFATAAGNSYSGTMITHTRFFNTYAYGVWLQGSDFHLCSVEVYPPGLSAFRFDATTVQATLLKSNYAGSRGVVGDTNGIMLTGNSCVISGGVFCQNDVGSFQSPQTFTANNASPCVFTVTGTAFSNGTQIVLSGASLPTGFTAGTVYFTVASAGSTFELAATPGGTAINSSSTGSGTATPANGNSVYISGSRNEVKAATAGASNAHLYLDAGATYNNIDITTTNQDNTTHANYIYVVNAASVKSNSVKIVGGATFLAAYSLLTNSGTEQNNQFSCEGEQYGTQNVAYAASVTPDPWLGGNVQIGTLTGNITINNPANGHAGTRMILRLLQDGTGGRTVTFGGAYKTAGAIPTTLSTATQIMFVLDGGGTWREVSRATA